MTVALEFERVSKHFRGGRGYRALRDDMTGAAARLVGLHRDPPAVVRALDDVSFEIAEGESFALIGPNGAGKTTALKLATRISYPTRGAVRVRGRVGALIEVGTGMHPELTGRENVQLYGQILGLSRRDVQLRFASIVEFADIGTALEQPVKQFSSGMQLRLGFALASHLEPDVLLVDEAIAVGDQGFQYRCVERMRELVGEGRTLVLVSHDMGAVETLCDRAILLRDGRIAEYGASRDVIRSYLLAVEAERLAAEARSGVEEAGVLEVGEVTLHGADGREVERVSSGEPLTVRLHYRARHPVRRPIFSVGLSDGRRGCFSLASMLIDGQAPELLEGTGFVECAFEALPLRPRTYEVWVSVRGEAGFGDLVDWRRRRLFHVVDELEEAGRAALTHSLTDAPVKIPYRWTVATDESRGAAAGQEAKRGP